MIASINAQGPFDRESRRAEMVKMLAAGATLATVAQRYGVSRERVRQIVSAVMVSGRERQAIRSADMALSYLEAIEAAMTADLTLDTFKGACRVTGLARLKVYMCLAAHDPEGLANLTDMFAQRRVGKHGSERRYRQGCRCEDCRAANAEVGRRYTGCKKRVSATHGSMAMYYRGCRCGPCRSANAAQWQDRKARKAK